MVREGLIKPKNIFEKEEYNVFQYKYIIQISMENLTLLIFFVCFGIAMRWGYKFLTGRSEWLDRDKPLNKICKVVLSYFLGGFVLVYKIIYWVFKIFKF